MTPDMHAGGDNIFQQHRSMRISGAVQMPYCMCTIPTWTAVDDISAVRPTFSVDRTCFSPDETNHA